VLATWPAVQHAGSRFLAGGAPGHAEAAPGDHLQTVYHFWLVGHQLEHGRAPWTDPYTFQPEASPQPNLAGWPFGLPFWPLEAAFGTVVGWNALVLLTFLGAGVFALVWLLELGLPLPAALAGGLAFELAPYRVSQSAGHLLGFVSILLPLALWAYERGRRGSTSWYLLAGAAMASIPLSGQVHLALGAIPFFAAYAAVRDRSRRGLTALGAIGAAGIVAGFVVQREAIAGSIAAGGRSLGQVASYSAELLDFVAGHQRHGSESFVFLGRLTPLLALGGLAVLVRGRRFGLAAVLGLGALVPMALALGTHLPSYSFLFHHSGVFRYPRVPERLMPIACLSLAALLAFAVDWASRRHRLLVPLAVVLLIGADLHVRLYGSSRADPANTAYTALAARPPARLLEVPVFLPDVHYGSVYLYYDISARRQRPGGYSTLAPPAARDLAQRLERINCGDWTGGTRVLVDALGVQAIALHRGLYLYNTALPNVAWLAWHGLVKAGYRPLATGGSVTSFVPGPSAAPPPFTEPPRDRPIFCQGWYQVGAVHPMSEPHAPLWIYGRGRLELAVRSQRPVATRIAVDGRTVSRIVVHEPVVVTSPLRSTGWHLVTFDVPHLYPTSYRAEGVELLRIRTD
jgi:hypothetical protein